MPSQAYGHHIVFDSGDWWLVFFRHGKAVALEVL